MTFIIKVDPEGVFINKKNALNHNSLVPSGIFVLRNIGQLLDTYFTKTPIALKITSFYLSAHSFVCSQQGPVLWV